MKSNKDIPRKLLKRLAHYHYYLEQLSSRRRDYVSSERLANDLGISIDDVREDLETLNDSLSNSDIHSVSYLKSIVELYLGNDKDIIAVIVGAGNLGNALYNYEGFKEFGLDIVAMFDKNPELIDNKKTHSTTKLYELITRLKVKIGIITTPPGQAQSIANIMSDAGVEGIWNFTQARIKVPEHIELKSTSLYSDYLTLTKRLSRKEEYQ